MLQAVLCAVCILSVVLLYQNYVVIPRQNRELVEELKSLLPGGHPSGRGLSRRERGTGWKRTGSVCR